MVRTLVGFFVFILLLLPFSRVWTGVEVRIHIVQAKKEQNPLKNPIRLPLRNSSFAQPFRTDSIQII